MIDLRCFTDKYSPVARKYVPSSTGLRLVQCRIWRVATHEIPARMEALAVYGIDAVHGQDLSLFTQVLAGLQEEV